MEVLCVVDGDVIAVKDVQDTVKQSIQTSYDNLAKVDRDEEMLNLITFQAAYTANAKIVTAIDDMLQTLLGMKR
jgi:flagellar hook-associated protein 1 FlgK